MLRWFPRTQWISLGIKCIETQLIFFFFRQGFTGTPAAAGESENKSQVPLLTPKQGWAGSTYGVRVGMCPDWRGDWLCCVQRAWAVPCFYSGHRAFGSQLFRSGVVFFNFLYFLSIISSTCTSTLFLVPYESESVSHSVMSDSLWLRGL